MFQGLAVVLSVVVGQMSDEYFQDPHPLRTLYRGPVLRLLDDPQTRLTLGLNSQQSANLIEFQRDLDKKQDEFFTKTESDHGRRFDQLKSGMDERQKRFLADFEKAVGESARRKLTGKALHFWGDLAPFAVGVAEELGVSRSQRSAAEAAVERFARKRNDVARAGGKPDEFDILVKALSHDLANLLTPEQRRKRDALAGPKPNWAPELYVESEAARQERENRPPTQEVFRDSRRLLKLVQVDDVLDVLKFKPEDRRQIVRWAREKSEEEKELAILKKEDADTTRTRAAKLASFDERVEKGLAEWLGPVKFERLKQIRWQLGGAGAVFGDAVRKEVGINDQQFHGVIARLHATIEKAQAEDSSVSDESEMHKRRAKRQQELDDVLDRSLSEDQRKKWRQLQGEPLDKATLHRIARRL